MPGTRKILARPVAPAKPIVLEEQDSGYKSNDQVEVKTIRRNTRLDPLNIKRAKYPRGLSSSFYARHKKSKPPGIAPNRHLLY
jgi:hypothetical protein